MRLVRDFNCRGCHQIGDDGRRHPQGGGEPARGLRRRRAAGAGALAAACSTTPSSKIGEGARVHTDWLHGFLADPSQRRSGPGSSCACRPSSSTEEQLNDAHALLRRPGPRALPLRAPAGGRSPEMVAAGRDLFTRWQCVKCHVVAGKLPRPGAGQHGARPGEGARAAAARLAHRVAGGPAARSSPARACPRTSPTKPEENAFPEILGGDQAKQIEAVRAYLLTLGRGGAQAEAKPSAAGARAGGR